jgi:hypothetical protein
MGWIIKDENKPKEIRFELEYLPVDNKYIIHGQYCINLMWLDFMIKEYSIEEFNSMEIGDILVDNYETLIKNINQYKETFEKMKNIKIFNIEFKKEE